MFPHFVFSKTVALSPARQLRSSAAPRQVHGLQRGLGHTAAELNGASVRKPRRHMLGPLKNSNGEDLGVCQSILEYLRGRRSFPEY